MPPPPGYRPRRRPRNGLPWWEPAGWFELYDAAGHYLGLSDSVLEMADWVQRQDPARSFRLLHRGPAMVAPGLEITGRWITSPQPGRALPGFVPVAHF